MVVLGLLGWRAVGGFRGFGLVWVCYGVGSMFRLGGLVGLLGWFCVVFCEFGWLLRCGWRLCLGCLGGAFDLRFVMRFSMVCGFLVVLVLGVCRSAGAQVFGWFGVFLLWFQALSGSWWF